MGRRLLAATAVGLVVTAVTALAAFADDGRGAKGLSRINHIVVIYEENHSFDNLYGSWEGVNGLSHADAAHTRQLDQSGSPFACLLQNDVNLVANPGACVLPNTWFTIDTYIPASATTCPPPGVFAAHGVPNGTGLPGGCTEDIVHRYYQEQFQIDHGKQDRYTLGSDAAGLTMGVYDTKQLPIYQYLHSRHHPDYAIGDNFFQGAFGGSFLNHQWLVAAAAPVFAGAVNDGSTSDLHSILDANGFPNSTYPLYHPATPVKDAQLTQACGLPTTVAGFTCGDYAVNTTQPWYQPYSPGTADARRLQPLHNPTIGDELSAKKVSWAWYSGGWSNANGTIGGPGWTNGDGPACSDPNALATAVYPNCPDKLFQFHHQGFNYFYSFRPGTWQRQQHLRDEAEFLQRAQNSDDTCRLKSVSFVKPIGAENEHPGYASEPNGSNHLVDLIKSIGGSKCARDTLVVVTYDEFGGQWDHVPPPGQGGAAGPHDQWGPGTRLPALFVAPGLRDSFVVDHTQYDTTSILATIEHRFGVAPLGTRDAAVNDFSAVFSAH